MTITQNTSRPQRPQKMSTPHHFHYLVVKEHSYSSNAPNLGSLITGIKWTGLHSRNVRNKFINMRDHRLVDGGKDKFVTWLNLDKRLLNL